MVIATPGPPHCVLFGKCSGSEVKSDGEDLKIVGHGRYVTFQMAEAAIPRNLFADILRRINRLRPRPFPI